MSRNIIFVLMYHRQKPLDLKLTLMDVSHLLHIRFISVFLSLSKREPHGLQETAHFPASCRLHVEIERDPI
jgi:hypothetical protein